MRIVIVEKDNNENTRKAVARMAFDVCQHIKRPIYIAKSNGESREILPWDSANQVQEIIERFYA